MKQPVNIRLAVFFKDEMQLFSLRNGTPVMKTAIKPYLLNIFMLSLLILLAGCRFQGKTSNRVDLPPNWQESSIEYDGLTRWYRIYLPETDQEQIPLIVYLHGGTLSMRSLFSPLAGKSNTLLDIASQEGVALLVPNAVNSETGDTFGDEQNWNDLRPDQAAGQSKVDDVGFINALLDLILEDELIDPDRIFVTGASNGGMMTYRLLIETPERFAAGAAFIANLPDLPDTLPVPSQPTALMILNGSADPLVPWGGGVVAKDRGEVISTAETVTWWISINHADPGQVETTFLPDLDSDDGCQIQRDYYPPGSRGEPVLVYSAWGGGHTLPLLTKPGLLTGLSDRIFGPVCRDADGILLAWEFFTSLGIRH